MKAIHYLLSLVLASGLLACSQVNPVSRDELTLNLAPVLKLERRIDQAKYYTNLLITSGGMSSDKAEDLKAHHDVYYVYYLAALVQLARGNIESYVAHVRLAERELDAMEAVLKDQLAQFIESEKKDWLSRSGL